MVDDDEDDEDEDPEVDPHKVTWQENDPENPQNWSNEYKVSIIFSLFFSIY